ncbi:amino acid adenylation domain-containing protein [Methylocaldum gracile]
MKNEIELSESKSALSASKRALLQERLQGRLIPRRLGPSTMPKRPQGPSPLSFSQQQLFFLDQLESDSAAYNFSIAVRLRGTLVVDALEKAINEIIRRHESLRTEFVIANSEPIQRVLPELSLSVSVEDLSGQSPSERRDYLGKLLNRESRTPFDLSECPLLRVRLFRLAEGTQDEQEHVLLITMPHIITDGWSAAVLYRELATLYEAYVLGRPSPLPELPIQYADFAYWQRQRLQPDVLAKMFSFWERHLSGSDSGFELPTDRTRPAVQTYRGSDYHFFLAKELTVKLNQLCRRRNVTLFALLFSAFNVLLHRYTGEQHICVGTPVANRNHAELEGLIGFFVNVLALQTDLSGNPKFTALLGRTRETMLDTQPHQEYPFELLVKKLKPIRDASSNPLFQVMFVLHNVPFDSIRVTGLDITPFSVENHVSKFDLTLHVTEEPDGLRTSLEYNVDLFDESTIARMASHFRVLLEHIADAPDTRISELRLLTPEENRQLTEEWSTVTAYVLSDGGPESANGLPARSGETSADGFIHALFEDQARRVPSAIALCGNGSTLTYAELNARANQLAHYLRSKGVGPGITVALCIGRLPEMVVGILGVLKAGGAYVPIDPKYPKDEIAYLLDDSGAALLLTRESVLAALPNLSITPTCVDCDWEAIAEQPVADPRVTIDSGDLAYVIYTSGSTGKPKGVAITHRNVLHSTQARFAYYRNPVESFLLLSSFAFDSSLAGIFWTLSQGGKLCIPDDSTHTVPAFLVDWIRKERITHLLGLPSFYNILLEQADAGQLDSLRAVIVAGEACSAGVAERHYAQLPGADLYNEYGPTEGTVWCTAYKIPPKFSEDSIPIGRPIPGARIYLLDAYLNPVPVGVPGELYIGGEGLAARYLNQPALTAERFLPNPFDNASGARLYRTGDRAHFRADGNIVFLGRADHQVKIRGFRVELSEIEVKLLKHPDIEAAVVTDHETPSGSKRLIAYLVPRQGERAADADGLRAFLQNMLPSYMIPSAFVFLDRLPLTPNGKLDRKALPSVDVRDQSEDRYVAPRTKIEAVLCAIWGQVLGLEKVGIQDNFFEIGGDSILSMQMVNRAKQAGLTIHPRQVFEYQTIEALAKAKDRDTDVQAEQGIITGEVPLTPIQRWFFEQSFPNPNHWNQSVLLEAKQPIVPAVLTDVIRHLLHHHDVLRTRFRECGGLWTQVLAEDVEGAVEIVSVDFSGLAEDRRQAALTEQASRWQRSLDLRHGPLIRVVWFDCGGDSSSRLLIIIHHLVVDGVSWRILLEDMSALYRQALAAREMRLPKKTTAFKQWAERLADHAQTAMPERNVAYWLNTDWSRIAALPMDFAGGVDSEATGETVTISLDPTKTSVLLQNAPLAYGARINEVLLAAVVAVLAEWAQSDSVFLEMESHGREYLFDDVDISRTVGWFTALFPVLFEISPDRAFPEIVQAVKEQLAVIPNHGIDYGVVRYLNRNPDLVSRLEAVPEPQIGFNYLGRIDQGTAVDAWFSLAPEPACRLNDPAGVRPRSLSIDASVVAGELRVHWSYSHACHSRETIERLAGRLLGILEDAAAACSAAASLGDAVNSEQQEPSTSIVNLAAEAILDSSITPAFRPGKPNGLPRNVLLTGITGFVGPFLLDELLAQTQGKIFCLVRSGSAEDAANKIEETLDRYAIHNPLAKQRIVPLPGDLAKPFLGLPAARFRELGDEVDVIYHNGSSTNLILSYPALKPANVSGTREILRLACTGTVKPVHYVSTLSIFDDGTEPEPPGFSEDDLPSLNTRLTMGYSQSKLVAEHLIRIARDRGLPVTVYRLGTVTGHGGTGAWNPNDFHCRFLKVCLDLGIFPTNRTSFVLTPVDFVSRAIVGLSALDSSPGRTYHVFNPHPTPVSDLIAWLDRYGYRIEKASPPEWMSAFSTLASRSPDQPLHTMAGMVESFVEHHHDGSVPYRCGTTAEALRQAGIALPTVDEGVFAKSLDYLVDAGVLERPFR